MSREDWCRQHGTHGAGTCPADCPAPSSAAPVTGDAQRALLDGLREMWRRQLLGVRTTDGNDTYLDGYAAGLAEAIQGLDRARAAALTGSQDAGEGDTP